VAAKAVSLPAQHGGGSHDDEGLPPGGPHSGQPDPKEPIARGTACAAAQVTTLRERLLKLAVWVERSVRRIVLHLPATFPWRSTWQHLARAGGATA